MHSWYFSATLVYYLFGMQFIVPVAPTGTNNVAVDMEQVGIVSFHSYFHHPLPRNSEKTLNSAKLY